MSVLILPTPTTDQRVLAEKLRRRGNAVDMLCSCCNLPFSEQFLDHAGKVVGINIYSRHFGKTHANRVHLNGCELVVTDAKEFVIVPSALELVA